MIDNIFHNLAQLKPAVKTAIVPIGVLAGVKAQMGLLARDYELNNFQQNIINERYVYEIADPAAKSIVIAAWPLQPSRLQFHYKGKAATVVLDDNYADNSPVRSRFEAVFAAAGHSLTYTHWLPQRHLAVRSGLCEYGRNNLVFCGDWGSFVRIGTYVSDIEANESAWRDTTVMPACADCGNCIHSCKMGALSPNRFLMDNEKCLTYHNYYDNLPDWIPPRAHGYLHGCYACQAACPANGPRLNAAGLTVFDEAQTLAILNCATFADLPPEIKSSLSQFDPGQKFPFIPRNLQLLLDNL